MKLQFLALVWMWHTATAIGPSDRIINGEVASSAPYQVKVNVRIDGSNSLCGGALVAESFVLTAAHCCAIAEQKDQSVGETFFVTAGSLKRRDSGTLRTANRVYIHPNWDNTDYASERGYDLCLLHLRSPFPMSDMISIIPIADSNPPAGTQVRVTGWGSVVAYANDSPSKPQLADSLREAWLTVVDQGTVDSWLTAQDIRTTCRVSSDIAEAYDYNGTIATGNSDGPVYDACQGDSGGPVAVQDASGSYSLVGVVSHGYGCGQASIPAFQASAVHSKEWIQQVISGTSGIVTCNRRTCGPGAECYNGKCVCKTGYSMTLGHDDMFGYTCRRWLNDGTVQQIGGYNVLYELVPISYAWGPNVIRSFGSPDIISKSMTPCGHPFYPRSHEESTTVAALVQTYASSAGLGSPPNDMLWIAVGPTSGGQWVAYTGPSWTTPLVTGLWANGEPNGEKCAVMMISGPQQGLWDAISCQNQTWFIIRYETSNPVAVGTRSTESVKTNGCTSLRASFALIMTSTIALALACLL